VYVRPFPGPGGRWQISTGGGASPTWSRRKRELFYGSLNGQIMVAPFAVEDDSSRAETPRLWSDRHFVPRGPNRVFDLHPDGERFAVLPDEETGRSLKQDHGGRGRARHQALTRASPDYSWLVANCRAIFRSASVARLPLHRGDTTPLRWSSCRSARLRGLRLAAWRHV
jgi:hypothetical protein